VCCQFYTAVANTNIRVKSENTSPDDEYVGFWNDNEFTEDVLHQIFEFEEQALGPVEGSCEYPFRTWHQLIFLRLNPLQHL
jgi:hypothetical protein